MSESYIGLAPSYGVFEKQVIAGTTAASYTLDFDVAQATQLMVSLDGIVQEPDYAYSVGRSATGTMQLNFASALTEQTASSTTLTSGSTTISALANTGLYNVGQPITGNANIPANTFITAIPSSTTLTISNAATGSGSTNQTIKIGSRIFVTYLGKQLLTPSANMQIPILSWICSQEMDRTQPLFFLRLHQVLVQSWYLWMVYFREKDLQMHGHSQVTL